MGLPPLSQNQNQISIICLKLIKNVTFCKNIFLFIKNWRLRRNSNKSYCKIAIKIWQFPFWSLYWRFSGNWSHLFATITVPAAPQSKFRICDPDPELKNFQLLDLDPKHISEFWETFLKSMAKKS